MRLSIPPAKTRKILGNILVFCPREYLSRLYWLRINALRGRGM